MFAVYIERRTYTPLQNFKNTFIDHSTYSTSFTRTFYTKLYCICPQQFTFEPYITRIIIYKAQSECLLIIFFSNKDDRYLVQEIFIQNARLSRIQRFVLLLYNLYPASHFVRVPNSCVFLGYVRKTGFTFYF